MPPIPWRRVKDWECVACGSCCRRFYVPLSREEAVGIAAKYGWDKLEIVHGKTVLKRVNGGCIFQVDNLCSLGNNKPIICKTWPILVMKKPVYGRGEEAAFQLDEMYYIYVDLRCPNIVLGRPSRRLVDRVIPEAIRIRRNGGPQRFTTSSLRTPIPLITISEIGEPSISLSRFPAFSLQQPRRLHEPPWLRDLTS